MSTVADLVAEVHRLGGRLVRDESGIAVEAPSALPEELMAELRRVKPALEALIAGWPEAALYSALRFGHAAAALYPYLGRTVEAPGGRGRLVQVLSGSQRTWAAVLPDGSDRVVFYAWDDVRPGAEGA